MATSSKEKYVCPNCGKSIGKMANYCRHCGYEIWDEGILYHYTSMEALFAIFSNIVKNEEKEPCVVLRASGCHFMNDPTEQKYMTDQLKDYIWRNPLLKDFYKVDLDFILTYAMDQDLFILSLSYNKDDLDMWRNYAKNGSGVAIGFNQKKLMDYLSKLNKKINPESLYKTIRMERCRYLCKEELFSFFKKNELLLAVTLNDGYVSEGFKKLASDIQLVKHPCYLKEKEARILINPNYNIKPKYRNANGAIIPFVEIPIPVSCIDTIVLGPCANDLNRLSVSQFTSLDINRSSLPYRQV